MSEEALCDKEEEKNDLKTGEHKFMTDMKAKMKATMNVDVLDKEIARDVERIVILRISTKHINLWIRQLEMKRTEMCNLAVLLMLDEVKKEIEKEKSLERWARRCTHHFTKNMKRLLFEEIDNMMWRGREKGISEWYVKNKVFDEIMEDEIEEIRMREAPDEDEPIRLNGKYVWETEKRV